MRTEKMSTEGNNDVSTQIVLKSDWTNVKGIAAYLKVSIRHVHNLMRRRIIPYHKLGRCIRLKISEVEAALKAYEIKSVAQFKN